MALSSPAPSPSSSPSKPTAPPRPTLIPAVSDQSPPPSPSVPSPPPPPPPQQKQQLPQPAANIHLTPAAASSPPAPSSSIDPTPRSKHQSTLSSSFAIPGLLTLAALARDKTTSAIASLSEPSLRPRTSSSSLYRSAQHPSTSVPKNQNSKESSPVDPKAGSTVPLAASAATSSSSATARLPPISTTTAHRQSLLETNPPSQPYAETPTDNPRPTFHDPRKQNSKMHQTSSRLLRMTTDERPFTRDFKDLFATLVVSLPLAKHRIRLTSIDHTFISDEAINNLGSLKFSQSNRMPDPKDPSRIVTTTTTTTFSMAREMARAICQRFLDARFIETADGKQGKDFKMTGTVWQLTPKGIHVLDRFCSRNGIQQRHTTELINSPRNTMQLVVLERDPTTDKLSSDKNTIEVVFRRFVGTNGPNIKSSITTADSESLSEYKDGLAGVRMASERKVGSPPRTVYQTFTGKAATDWLMDCCTTVDRRETVDIAQQFLENEFIWCVQADRAYLAQHTQEKDAKLFQPTKHAIYQLSQRGKDVINMIRERKSESEGSLVTSQRPGVSRDSNTQKLDKILNDAALRLLFRENLRDTHCEENLSFYLEVDEFLRTCKAAIKNTGSGRGDRLSIESVKETMASAYGIYNAFLAPGSPCELNIDHALRNQLATRMTKAVGQDAAMIDSLREVTQLFEDAQISVFKLMASDSVPKFMKSAKYENVLRNYDFDSITSGRNGHAPERSMSRSNTSTPPNR